MRKRDNPFEPGAGTRPPELVGRDLILEDADAAIAKGAAGRPIRGQVFYGLRGVGKTVILRSVSDIAQKQGALVADLEAPEGAKLVEIVAPALRKIILELSGKERAKDIIERSANALQAFASKFKVTIGDLGVEVRGPVGIADSGKLETDLPDLFVTVGEAAKARGKIVILAIDELQYLPIADLSALVTAIHKVNQKSLPIGLFGAGLPNLLADAGNAKSYSERLFQFVKIDALGPAEVERALRDPIRAAKAEIEQGALDFIVEQSKGYAYFVQEWGFRTWNQAKQSPITRKDAEAAEKLTTESLDNSFFRVRFDRLTAGEKDYLRAMAELGPGPHKSGEVARVLGKKVTQTGTTRSKVIAKGMAYGGQYGLTHFSVPLFDEFMRREMPDFEPKAAPGKPAKKK